LRRNISDVFPKIRIQENLKQQGDLAVEVAGGCAYANMRINNHWFLFWHRLVSLIKLQQNRRQNITQKSSEYLFWELLKLNHYPKVHFMPNENKSDMVKQYM